MIFVNKRESWTGARQRCCTSFSWLNIHLHLYILWRSLNMIEMAFTVWQSQSMLHLFTIELHRPFILWISFKFKSSAIQFCNLFDYNEVNIQQTSPSSKHVPFCIFFAAVNNLSLTIGNCLSFYPVLHYLIIWHCWFRCSQNSWSYMGASNICVKYRVEKTIILWNNRIAEY